MKHTQNAAPATRLTSLARLTQMKMSVIKQVISTGYDMKADIASRCCCVNEAHSMETTVHPKYPDTAPVDRLNVGPLSAEVNASLCTKFKRSNRWDIMTANHPIIMYWLKDGNGGVLRLRARDERGGWQTKAEVGLICRWSFHSERETQQGRECGTREGECQDKSENSACKVKRERGGVEGGSS